jgi:hypothetical protein
LKGFFMVLTCICLISCASMHLSKKDNGSIIAISATSKGFLAKGYGIEITLVNIDTHVSIKSKPLSPFSSHSLIQNIPSGRYIVQQVMIPVGNINYSNWSDSVKTFFGQITIEPNSKYYLGDFCGTRDIGGKNILHLKLCNQDIPKSLKEKIEKENTGWANGDFVRIYPYLKEELLVY